MSLSTIERVLFLREVDLFGKVHSEDLVHVARIAQEVTFHLGETFIRQGEIGDCLYIVIDGEAGIVIEGVGQVAHRLPKSIIGELAIISRGPRSANCVALTDITALKIEHDDFWDLLTDQPEIAQGVIRMLSQRYEEAVANLRTHGLVAQEKDAVRE
jgi:CRP/FNR family cyclic AMP-dependent transcriptional regulator